MKFQTPAEEIYTLAKNQAGMGKLVSNSIGVNLHIMANFEETSIGLFQTPAEEIYTRYDRAAFCRVIDFKLHRSKFTQIISLKLASSPREFQTPAEEIYTLNSSILSHLSSVSNSSGGNLHFKNRKAFWNRKKFQTPAEEIYTEFTAAICGTTQFQTPAEEIYTNAA